LSSRVHAAVVVTQLACTNTFSCSTTKQRVLSVSRATKVAGESVPIASA
jgi:hypothetical protein